MAIAAATKISRWLCGARYSSAIAIGTKASSHFNIIRFLPVRSRTSGGCGKMSGKEPGLQAACRFKAWNLLQPKSSGIMLHVDEHNSYRMRSCNPVQRDGASHDH